jgi:hypothetical protein
MEEVEFRIGNLSADKFYSIVCNGILVSLVFVLFGSVSHLAYTFNTVEVAGSGVVGWIIAFGIESGLMWLAFGLSEKRKNNDKTRLILLTSFMFAFCFINFLGNYYYGISRYLENEQLLYADFIKVDQMIHYKTLLLSASLPLIALALIEVYAIFTHRKTIEKKKQERLIKQSGKDEKNVKTPKIISKKQEVTNIRTEESAKQIIGKEIESMDKKKLESEDISDL